MIPRRVFIACVAAFAAATVTTIAVARPVERDHRTPQREQVRDHRNCPKGQCGTTPKPGAGRNYHGPFKATPPKAYHPPQ